MKAHDVLAHHETEPDVPPPTIVDLPLLTEVRVKAAFIPPTTSPADPCTPALVVHALLDGQPIDLVIPVTGNLQQTLHEQIRTAELLAAFANDGSPSR